VRWRRLSRAPTIPRRDDRGHVLRLELTAADIDERAGDRAHHVAQEAGAVNLEAK
jgi:hypothetical protein